MGTQFRKGSYFTIHFIKYVEKRNCIVRHKCVIMINDRKQQKIQPADVYANLAGYIKRENEYEFENK